MWSKLLKWLAFALAAFALLLIGVAVALQYWLRTDDFRGRVEREASAALGVPFKMGRLSVDLWPLPAVAVDNAQVLTRPALTVGRVEARPVWTSLLVGKPEIATLIVRKAVLPQSGINALGAALQKKAKPAAKPTPAAATTSSSSSSVLLPRRAVFEDITWIDEKGQRMTVDAKAELGDDGRVDNANFKIVQGRFAGTRGELRREPDHWPVKIEIGGGRITGRVQLTPGAKSAQLFQGQFTTEGVEVSALTAPSKTLTGKLQAQTTLRSEYREIGQIADQMVTRTQFTVRDAVIDGLDLVKAVETVGLSRGGLTRLSTLAGQVNTQGKTIHLNDLVATATGLTATGNVTIAPSKALNGKVTVDVQTSRAGMNVPLQVGGTIDDPSVMLTREALAGAAVGVLTAPGRSLGDKLKGLFGK